MQVTLQTLYFKITTMQTNDTALETKLAEIKTEVGNVQERVTTLAVKSEADVEAATTFLADIKARIDRVEQLRKFFVEDISKWVRAKNAAFKAASEPLEQAFDAVKRQINAYRLEQERAARAEEERLRKLQEKKNERREAAGKPLDMTPAPVVERPQAVVRTEAGKAVTTKVWKYRLVDINAVPREYLRCEVKALEVNRAIAAGVREIAGLEIYEDFDTKITSNG